jgi:hypothetical protein
MPAETTSWRWQLEQLQQRLGEWIEAKLTTPDRDLSLDIFPAWLAPLLTNLLWLTLAAMLAWVGYRFIYPYLRPWLEKLQQPAVNPASEAAPEYTIAQLLDRSRQFQTAGDYTQASRWLYLAMLQRLNDAQLIPHRSSRTDREYLRVLSAMPATNVGEILISIHEQLHFGDRQIPRADFDRCQQAYQQLDREIIASSTNV